VGARIGGESLQEPAYLKLIKGFQNQGFEIALHNVRNSDATREMVEKGLDVYSSELGSYPRAHANHAGNKDNLYWGDARLTDRSTRWTYNMATRFGQTYFSGHIESSPFYWGDICAERISYVRSFVFKEINLLKVTPVLPYRDLQRPFVKQWFTSSEGAHVDSFCKLLGEENQDSLEEEGGVCIMYTHFGAPGFVTDGVVHPRVSQLLRRLASKNGYFVDVSTLLDVLAQQNPTQEITPGQRSSMERRWLTSKLRRGSS